jgi:Fe2+ transport system protein FeoA
VCVESLTANEPQTIRRLAELGLTPGASITVLQRSSIAVVISSRGSRIAVGTPLASAVIVNGSTNGRKSR